MPDLLGLRHVSAEQIHDWIKQSRSMAEILARPVAKVPALRGKRVALLFFESSTRTKMSFELAVKSLGADVIGFSASSSSLSKGESVLDTAMTIMALGANAVVVRDRHAMMPAYLSKHLNIPIINAGDGTNEHPTQALLDLAVLANTWNDQFAGKILTIVGDISRSRVARSHFWAAKTLGITIRVVAPGTFVEPGLRDCFGFDIYPDLDTGLAGADAVMALRVQNERRGVGGPYLSSQLDYFLRYGLTREKISRLAPNSVLLHPGPVNRAVELAPDLLYDAMSKIQDQVSMGVATRMAALYWAFGGDANTSV